MGEIIGYVKQILPVVMSAGFGTGMVIGTVSVVLGYVIRKVQDLVDING